ncbi:hypothetical protein [Ilumatobacter sp.]|uniref:hypothetical protein n=1 Tax=Ilumatobacter sp. TaxID=1967498 RepID=UPI003C5929A5
MATTKPDHPIRTLDPVDIPRAEWVSFLIGALIALVIGISLPFEANRVEITIHNPTDHRLYISATTPEDSTETPVAVVEAQATRTADVIDRGPDWTLHVRSTSTYSGTATATRTELTSGVYTIPTRIGDDFTAAGVIPDDNPAEPSSANPSD